jgi:hypothetical protein
MIFPLNGTVLSDGYARYLVVPPTRAAFAAGGVVSLPALPSMAAGATATDQGGSHGAVFSGGHACDLVMPPPPAHVLHSSMVM